MTIDRRSLLSGAGALGTAALAAPAPSIAADSTVWRMVTTWPRNAPGVGVNAQRFADRVGAMSGGRLQIELAAAGELIPAFEALDAVQQGTADLCHSAPFFWLGKSPALNYFGSIPLGLLDSEIAAWLYFGGGMALWDEAMADFGIKPFFAGSSGISAGGWYRKEILGLEDLKGLKLRMAGLGGEVMKRLGATPVLTPPAEVFQAMASGTVDAAELIGPWNDMAFGLFEVADYYYLPGFHEVGPTAEILINRQAWDGPRRRSEGRGRRGGQGDRDRVQCGLSLPQCDAAAGPGRGARRRASRLSGRGQRCHRPDLDRGPERARQGR